MDFSVELGNNVLGHNFLDIIDLDVMEQTIIEDVMAEISTSEQNISLSDPILSCNHSDDDLITFSSTDCVVPVAMVTNNKPVMKDVIKASDVEGLLEQFEEASNDLCTESLNKENSIETTKSEVLTLHTVEETSSYVNNNGIPPKKELTNEVLQKLKASRKPKTAVMLPMVVPAKRGRGRAMTRGHPVAMPANCTPRRLQRVMMQNSEIKDSLALVEEVVVSSDKIQPNSNSGRKMESLLKKNNIVSANGLVSIVNNNTHSVAVDNNSDKVPQDNNNDNDIRTMNMDKELRTNINIVTVDQNYFEKVPDHDYIKSVHNDNIDAKGDTKVVNNNDVKSDKKVIDSYDDFDKGSKKVGDKLYANGYRKVVNDNNDYEDGEICDDDDSGFRDNDGAYDRDTKCHDNDDSINAHLFDKLPSYYTALSIPRKQVKKTASCVTGRGGITIQDYIQRDISPHRDPDAYSKLPDYFSSFTNSTRYDSKYNDKIPKYSESNDENDSYSNMSQNSTYCDKNVSSRPSSHSRSRSRSVSRSKSNHKSQGRRQSSYSSYSGYSSSGSSCSRSSCSHRSRSNSSDSSRSSSCSTCSSRSSSSMSRSRSRSPDRSWQRERNSREQHREQRRERSVRRKSRKYERERSRSRSRHYSYTRSRSRDYRSRSRSVSRHHRREHESVSRQSRHRRDRKSVSRHHRDHESKEKFREERKKEREEEKQQQMKERRIVYVGGLPPGYSRHTLRDLFTRFGPIDRVQLHFRERGDNYGFVTFTYTCDAYAAIEKGRNIPGLEKFDLCFGGRRQFCDVEYADLDGNKEIEEEFDTKPQSSNSFDELLRQAKAKIKKS